MGRVNTVDEYVGRFDGEPRAWLTEFIEFMRTHYPAIPEAISYQMPMYKFDNTYIAFSAAKNHFTFHTLDFDRIEELKSLLPKASFGKGSAKVKYSDQAAKPVLFDMCHRIIAAHLENKDV